MKNSLYALLIGSLVTWGVTTAVSQGKQKDETGDPPHRYSVRSAGSGQIPETYVLDTVTGRLWQLRGQTGKEPFLYSCMYSTLEGKISLTPVAAEKEIGDYFANPKASEGDRKLKEKMDTLFPGK